MAVMRTRLPFPFLSAAGGHASKTAVVLVLVLSFAPSLKAQEGTTLGLSVGIRPLQRGYPESPGLMTGISAWTLIRPVGSLALHVGLRYAAWEAVPTDALPLLPPSWGSRNEYVSDRVSGYEFGLTGGPAIQVVRSRAFSAGFLALAAVQSYCENRIYRFTEETGIGWAPPPSHLRNRGRSVAASFELRMRLAFGPTLTAPALEVGRVWSLRRWELSDNAPATAPATGYLVAIAAPFSIPRSRPPSAPPSVSLGSRYLKGVRGAAFGLLGGTVTYAFAQAASGVVQIGGPAYSGFVPLGGIIGSALAFPGDGRATPTAWACRLLGGVMAAWTHAWFMRTRFGMDTPDPLLAFTIPIGTILLSSPR
jgi:hypothetical protein